METQNRRCIANMVRTGADITRHRKGTTKEVDGSEDAEIYCGYQAEETSFGPRYGHSSLPVKDPANTGMGVRPRVVDDGHHTWPFKQPGGYRGIVIKDEGSGDISTRGTTEMKQMLIQEVGEKTCTTSVPKPINQGYSNDQPNSQSRKQWQAVNMYTKRMNGIRGAIHIPASQPEPRSRIAIPGIN